jgi:sialidase-1
MDRIACQQTILVHLTAISTITTFKLNMISFPIRLRFPILSWFSFTLCIAIVMDLSRGTANAQNVPDAPLYTRVIRKPGDDQSRAYRIPGLSSTSRGTLVAVFDIRYENSKDLPANIDVGMMRSTDNGNTWGPMQRILDFDQSVPHSRGNGVGDPAILFDAQTHTLFVAALWSQGDRAWNGSGPGLSPEETGQFVLTKSHDDGVTWSPPINITQTIQGRDPTWRLLFNGPGAGIQLRDGSLVFAAQYRDANGIPHSCFLLSRDHGKSWSLSPAAIPNQPPTSEAQIVQLADDSLLITMRDESKSGSRAWAKWNWATDATSSQSQPLSGSWSKPWHAISDPTCMASLIMHPTGILLFSNPNSPTKREALTIRSSEDQGQTWSHAKLLDARGCMYSCMCILKDGQVGILYEVEGTLTFARFPLSWVSR